MTLVVVRIRQESLHSRLNLDAVRVMARTGSLVGQGNEPNVEGINPAPHIHEQMATSNYVQMATTLRTPLRITTSRLSTMR